MVMTSSLFIVGSPLWVPLAYAWAWKRWKRIPKEEKKQRAIYASMLLSFVTFAAIGPYRSPSVGRWIRLKKWQLWKAWLKFVAFEVIADSPSTLNDFDFKHNQAIYAISPHGIFPFALGFAVLPELASRVFGEFRPVVATATSLFPFLRTILSWLNSVDASRPSVDQALKEGSRIGLAPGGIAEMFEGYPKPGTHPNEEYVILNSRKGFVRMAIKHGVPLIPVYCFGSTKMFRRLELPALEHLSKLLRISICVFFGSWGLPMPFRQRLLYVMGSPLFPPNAGSNNTAELDQHVDALHARFCNELIALFDRHKESYGWDRKTLRVV
jgi:2-acylglycerol O-acyltransferase 2